MIQENWIDRLVKQDYFTTIRRFTIAALLAASTLAGPAMFIATGVIAPLISVAQHYFEKKRKQKLLLNFYQDEIGAIEHKAPDALTLEDLEKSGKASTAIHNQLTEYQTTQNQRIGISFVSSLLTVGALLTATSLAGISIADPIPEMPTILQLGLVATGYWTIRNTVSATARMILGHDEDTKCFSEKLMELGDHIKQKPINPVQLFSIFAEANPTLQDNIKQRYGKTFDQLSAIRKKEVVDAYEPEFRVTALTEALNRDEIKPSLVGFLAYNQAEGLPGYEQYKALFNAPITKAPAIEADAFPTVEKEPQHAKRIRAEQETVPLFGRVIN
jgi:anion-transporting  ArsA/GET3 family ATPase